MVLLEDCGDLRSAAELVVNSLLHISKTLLAGGHGSELLKGAELLFSINGLLI